MTYPDQTLPYGAPIDLSNCEREPIHIPGQIQSHGALWVVERATRKVVQVSDNLAAFIGRSGDLLGRSLAEAVGDLAARQLDHLLDAAGAERVPRHVLAFDAGYGMLDVIFHLDGPLAIFEVEWANATEAPVTDFFEFASRTAASMVSAVSNTEYCQRLAEAIRQLTGYDRVMIYRFSPDWHGEVFAESMAPGRGLAPFLGLHYPASDIPAQARALFLKNTVRMLADARYEPAKLLPELNPVTGAPLDLSHAFLRGASQMYTEYLINMGVSASLTLAINDGDKLWGLVACHHYAPRRISHAHRVVCDLLARVASLQILDRARAEEARYRAHLERIHSRLVEALATGDRFGAALGAARDELSAFIESAGVAVVSGGTSVSAGRVPPAPHLERLASLFTARAVGRVLPVERLVEHYPEAAEIEDVCAGVLVLPLGDAESGVDEIVMWFRPEVVDTVSWAGDPHKPVQIGPMGDRLTPRKSFELWQETVRHSSLPWTPMEIAAAERLRTSFVEILARRHAALERLNAELARTNAELDSFAYIASHDLKEPLRGIYNHAAFLLKEAAPRLMEPDVRRLEGVMRLATRTRDLVDALLEFSRLGRAELQREQAELGLLVAAAVENTASTLAARNATIAVAPGWPRVWCVPHLVTAIFGNLISNAAKYNDSAAPSVEVGWVAAGDAGFPSRARGYRHVYYVRDNGIGIPERHAPVIFEIFKRLHAQSKYGGGTGAGLTITKRAVERMNGTLWFEPVIPQGTTFWFVIDEAPGGEPTT